MDKREIFSHFKSILDEMVRRSVFMKTYLQAPQYVENMVYGGNNGIPANISLATGVTRACIIDDDYDWVVKFDIEEDGRGSACEREQAIYAMAKEDKLDKYFAEVIYIGTYTTTYTFYSSWQISDYLYFDDYNYEDNQFSRDFYKYKDRFGNLETITVTLPLYAYRRINEGDNYNDTPLTDEERTELDWHHSPLNAKNRWVAAEFMRQYGIDQYKKLTDFLNYNDVNDFHSGNVGFIDGNFVLIDYAGYYDREEYSCNEEEENDRWNS